MWLWYQIANQPFWLKILLSEIIAESNEETDISAIVWQIWSRSEAKLEVFVQLWVKPLQKAMRKWSYEWEFSKNSTRNIVFQGVVPKIWPSKAQNGTCAEDLNQIWVTPLQKAMQKRTYEPLFDRFGQSGQDLAKSDIWSLGLRNKANSCSQRAWTERRLEKPGHWTDCPSDFEQSKYSLIAWSRWKSPFHTILKYNGLVQICLGLLSSPIILDKVDSTRCVCWLVPSADRKVACNLERLRAT